MTITLDLPPYIEQGLQAKAAARGLTLEVYLRELVAREADPDPAPHEDRSDPKHSDPGPRKSKLLQVCAMVRGLTGDADFGRNPRT